MATFVYDDFRVRLTPLDGDEFVVHVVADGRTCVGRFRLPLDWSGLERAVVEVGRSRDVGTEPGAAATAEQFGGALADGVFDGAVGEAMRRRWSGPATSAVACG